MKRPHKPRSSAKRVLFSANPKTEEMPGNGKKRQYFPILDGFRFFAFLLIFSHHATFYFHGDYPGNLIIDYLHQNGWAGVSFFFCLTGFLTTHSLLSEFRKTGVIDGRRFLFRRLVRLWPLYGVSLFVGSVGIYQFNSRFGFVYPGFTHDLLQHLPWFLAFAGNWGVVLYGWGPSRAVSQLWAICVDMQFLVVWPWIVLLMRTPKRSFLISGLCIILAILARYSLLSSGVEHPQLYANTLTWLDAFAAGAVVAQLLIYRPAIFRSLQRLCTVPFLLAVLSNAALYLYTLTMTDGNGSRQDTWSYLFMAVTAAYLIAAGIAAHPTVLRILGNRLFSGLGKLGYGLFAWHVFALEVVYTVFANSRYDPLVPVAGFFLTIILSWSWNRFVEQPLLGWLHNRVRTNGISR